MFGFGPATRIYLAPGATDMRKNFNGLYGLVRDRLGCDPESGHVFLFANARRYRPTFRIPIAIVRGRICLASTSW
jgi:transposase